MTDLVPFPDQDPDVIEGEVVDESEVVLTPVRRVGHAAAVAVRHPRTQAVARNASYLGFGVVAVFQRLWNSRTAAPHERGFRAAESVGDQEKMLAWEQRRAQFKKDRHARTMAWVELPWKIIQGLPKVGIGFAALLAFIGICMAVGERRPAALASPFYFVATLVTIVILIVSVGWVIIVGALAAAGLSALWWLGRAYAQASSIRWVGTGADPDADVQIDERLITQALEAMRIPQIRDYLKQGMPLQFLVPCRQEGRGTYAEMRLPRVPAERIARRRADFAAGLYRLPKEVWPSTGSEAAILRVWIADKGALEAGAGPYPLLDEGFTDVFKGVPFGRSLRGDPMTAPLMERNTLTGGMPGQGKSSAARAMMAGAALDPTAELRIWVPDTNFDFEAFRPRCSRYVMGSESEHIEQIRDDLIELKAEIQERGQVLIDQEVPAATRELANTGLGLHPLFCLLEEAHVAITHAEFGKEISGLLVDIVRLGRKRGIHMLVSTQAPTKDSMPRDVTRNCSNGIAFAVGDHVANDALLGQGAYAGGHRATELIPGTDKGTALVKGFSGERSEMAQVYFIDVSRERDQITPIIERSLAEIARRGRAVPGTGRRRVIETRDLLADLDEVLGDDKVKVADLPALLRDLAPSWGPYRTVTRLKLRDQLEAEGVRVTNTRNVMRLDPADLRAVLARRGEGE
jgi:S-DNA-T family DNA segregation ATPase FtsK/SpoIIIE